MGFCITVMFVHFPGGRWQRIPLQWIQEMGVPSLGQEDPLGEGMAAHSMPGESHGQRAWRATVHGLKRIGHDLATKKRWFVLLIL